MYKNDIYDEELLVNKRDKTNFMDFSLKPPLLLSSISRMKYFEKFPQLLTHFACKIKTHKKILDT